MTAQIRRLEHETRVLNLTNEATHEDFAQRNGRLQRAEAGRIRLAEDLLTRLNSLTSDSTSFAAESTLLRVL